MAKEFVMGARLVLKDKFIDPMKKATKGTGDFAKSADKADKATKAIKKDMDAGAKSTTLMGTAAKKAGAAITAMGDKLRKSGKEAKSAKDGFDGLRGGIGKTAAIFGSLAAAAGATAFAYSSVKKAMQFEAQMSTIKALTGATNDEMREMQGLALKMGAQTKYSALEAAQGIEELLKAGLTPAQVKAEGLQAALNIATAGGLELAAAAEVMATSLNAFKFEALGATKAADILAGTANVSATGVEELRQSLAMVAPVAAMVKMRFVDVNTSLGLFANKGFKGSDAGTSLKTMLMNLNPRTKEQITVARKLGILTGKNTNAFYDQTGKLKGLEQVAGVMQTSFKKLTDQQRLTAMEIIFGSDSVRAASILYDEGAAGVKKFREEMLKVTALNVAKEKMNNAAGAVEEFAGAIETLQISALLPTMPIIKDMALAAADFAAKYTLQITAAMQRAVTKARSYFKTHFTDNPEFKKLSISGKIGFIVDDVTKSLNEWLANGGQAKLDKYGAIMGNTIANGLAAAAPRIGKAAVAIGKATGLAMLEAFNAALSSSPLGAIIAGAAGGAVIGSVVPGVGTAVGAVAGAAAGGITYAITGPTNPRANTGPPPGSVDVRTGKLVGGKKPMTLPSHAAGLDRVPYDGYIARLHKDETVLNKGDADDRRAASVSATGVAPKQQVVTKVTIQKLVESITIDGANKANSEIVNEIVTALYDKFTRANEILANGEMGALLE
jgi:TP901 family phage tail tape measure protein